RVAALAPAPVRYSASQRASIRCWARWSAAPPVQVSARQPLQGSIRSATRFNLGNFAMSTIAKHIARATIVAAILLGVTACGDTWGQRAVTGGGIGAGTGAVVGAVTGLGPLTGAVIGGAAGAGIGAATTPNR